MNNVLQLLQNLGENASLRHISAKQLEKVLNPLNLDPAVQQAICQHDDNKLARLLHANNKIVCMIHPAEEPAHDDQPAEPPIEKPADTPEQDDTELKQAG